MNRVVRRLLLIAVGSAVLAPAAQAGERSPERVPGRYIVVYEQSLDRPGARTNRLQRAEGFRTRLRYGHAVKGFAAELTDAQLRALRADPAVAFAVPDRVAHATAAVPLVGGERAPTGTRRMRAATTTTARQASTVNVAVVDTGIDLAADVNAVSGKNCVGDGPATDGNGHGTHVAGTIGARNGGSGVVGVAPGTRQYAVKVLDDQGSGDWSQIICGIDWVASTRSDADTTNDIAVANLSLGGGGSSVRSCSTTTDALHLAICRATQAGVTFVVAAGNEGWSFDHATNPDVPASYPEVLTVTAVSDSDGTGGGTGGAPSCRSEQGDDRPATFSNYAASSAAMAHTVAAPGVCIDSTVPGGGVGAMSGTSMAAPHVAGAVALCFGEAGATGPCTGLTPAQVVAKVRADAEAASRAGADLGFTGDPLTSPVTGRYYGFLFAAPASAPASATASADADKTQPTTGTVTPGAGATGVASATAVSVAFSEAMDKASAQAAFAVRRSADGAAVPGAYTWSTNTLTFRPSAALAAGTAYTARVTTGARDLAGNALSAERSWSFTTAPESTAKPYAAGVYAGSLAGGSAASLAAEDGAAYQVRSTTSGTRTASWYARMSGVSNGLRSLRITYAGRSSAACSQGVYIVNWRTGGWVQLDARTAGTTQSVVDRTVSGTLADYVSGTTGTGEVRVRVTCTSATGTFTTAGDLVRATTT